MLFQVCKLNTEESPEKENWIECTICGQWFHCECISITLADAENNQTFACSEI